MGGQQIGNKERARSSQQQNRMRKKGIWNYGRSTKYYDYIREAMPALQGLYEPSRVQESDQAALGEQEGLQGMDVAAGRTGMLGSGAHLGGRSAVRANRQAMANQALVNSYMKALGMVSGQAGATMGAMQSFMGGQPQLSNPTINPYGPLLNTGANALGLWLANYQSNRSPYAAVPYGGA